MQKVRKEGNVCGLESAREKTFLPSHPCILLEFTGG